MAGPIIHFTGLPTCRWETPLHVGTRRSLTKRRFLLRAGARPCISQPKERDPAMSEGREKPGGERPRKWQLLRGACGKSRMLQAASVAKGPS